MTSLSAPLLSQTALFDEILSKTFSTMSFHFMTASSMGDREVSVQAFRDVDWFAVARPAIKLVKEIKALAPQGAAPVALSNGWTAGTDPHEDIQYVEHERGNVDLVQDDDLLSILIKTSSPKGKAIVHTQMESGRAKPAIRYDLFFDDEESIRQLVSFQACPSPAELHAKIWKGVGFPMDGCSSIALLGSCNRVNADAWEGLIDEIVYDRTLRRKWNAREFIELHEAIRLTNGPSVFSRIQSVTLSARVLVDGERNHLSQNTFLKGLWNYLTGSI